MSTKKFQPLPAQPAPVKTSGPFVWIKNNLYSSIPNIIATKLILLVLVIVIPPLVDWFFISATFVGANQDACNAEGACWVFIKAWSRQFFYGSYYDGELWRVNLSLVLLFATIFMSFLLPTKHRNIASIVAFALFPVVCILLLDGRFLGLEYVPTHKWGGFSLNVLLAAVTMVVAFPLGFLWALGRRSTFPFIRSVCITCIEFFRGTPILALFFMGSVMLPLFFPEGVTVDRILRVWIILVLFMASYMAEVFRSGFQAIPSGQFEAANSLGLSYWQSTCLIIFPQVVKVAMPNILATFVMLFKNTVFLFVIGVPEVLQIVNQALSNSNWLGGHAIEGYLFVGFIFWCCCYGMSLIAGKIESSLNTDKRD